MKLKIKNSIVCCLILISFSKSFAQFAQYEEPAAKFNNTPGGICECQPPGVFFNYTIGIIESIWGGLKSGKNERRFARDMQNSFESEIENELGKNFENFYRAKDAFFEEWSDDGLSKGISDFVSETDKFASDFNQVADELNALDQRATELNSGNIDNPYLGEFYVNNMPLRSLRTIAELKTLRDDVLRKYQGLDAHINRDGRTNIYAGSRSLRRNEQLVSNALASQYSKEYDRLFWKVSTPAAVNYMRNFITAYRIRKFESTQERCGPPLLCSEGSTYEDMLNNGQVFVINPKDKALDVAYDRGRGADPYVPTTRPLESLRNQTAYDNLGTQANSYINRFPDVKKAIDNYFNHYNFNKPSQDCVNYLFQQVLGNGDFSPDTNDYKANNTPNCRGANTPNNAIDMQWKPSSIELGYQGFQNIMAELNNIPENNQKIGHVIKDILSVNGKGLPQWMDDVLVGRYFNFRIVPADATGVQIDFRDGFGTEAWNDGITTNEAIYDHIRRVDFIGAKLELNDLQINILLDASSFVKELFDFISQNEDDPIAVNFAQEALESFSKGFEVDIPNQVIKNSTFLHSRANCLYELLKNTNGNLFRNTIRNFIGDTIYNLRFTLETPFVSTAEGDTDAAELDTNGVITIRLNPRTIETSLPIQIASLILHEGIHAEIYRFVHSNDPNVKPQERARVTQLLLFYKGSEWGTDSRVQHIHMTENYVVPIAKALQEIDGNRFSVDHYMWFAWDGLRAHVPDAVKPTDEQNANWELLSRKVRENNNLPCD